MKGDVEYIFLLPAALLVGFTLLPYAFEYATFVWGPIGVTLLTGSGVDISGCKNFHTAVPPSGISAVAASFPKEIDVPPATFGCANCYLVWCEKENGGAVLYRCIVYPENYQYRITCEKLGETREVSEE